LDGIYFRICNDKTLCNGSSRLAEISTMMILLPAYLLLISFFTGLWYHIYNIYMYYNIQWKQQVKTIITRYEIENKCVVW
jgi:hypothetical protein